MFLLLKLKKSFITLLLNVHITFTIGQLRDYEGRLDQEGKVFIKADEKRKEITMDVNKMRHNVLKEQAKLCDKKLDKALKKVDREFKGKTAKMDKVTMGSLNSYVTKLSNSAKQINIAPNKRLLDLQKGPIKKTAAIRRLPTVER